MIQGETLRTALYLAAAYLAGALPTGYLAVRWIKGIDIRSVGSGNTGATNVFRTLGWKAGLAVLLVDMAKGWLAVAAAPWFGISAGGWQPLAAALVVVLGHNYTCFLSFKGGKGVATSTGVLFGLAPLAALSCMAAFAVAFALTRMISVGSLTGAAILPLAVYFLNEGGRGDMQAWQPVLWLSIALSAFVWVRHIPNLKRLAEGTETRLTSPSRKSVKRG